MFWLASFRLTLALTYETKPGPNGSVTCEPFRRRRYNASGYKGASGNFDYRHVEDCDLHKFSELEEFVWDSLKSFEKCWNIFELHCQDSALLQSLWFASHTHLQEVCKGCWIFPVLCRRASVLDCLQSVFCFLPNDDWKYELFEAESCCGEWQLMGENFPTLRIDGLDELII